MADRTSRGVTQQGNDFNKPMDLVRLDADGRLPAVDASLLTHLPSGGIVDSVVAGAGIAVDNTDPANPIVSATPLVPASIGYAANYTPDPADGLLQLFALTGAATLLPPSSPVDGMRMELWVKASGAQNLTFDPAIVIPSDSAFGGVKAIADGAVCIVLLKYCAAISSWMLVSIVGGYS